MEWSLRFVLTSIFMGVGLAMDAFSVSMANGLNEPQMTKRKMSAMAAVFAGFQCVMPLLGWWCIHTVVNYFTMLEQWIPWIALILLAYIGGKMLWEGVQPQNETDAAVRLKPGTLLIQGIATSIDALSVGFTIASYNGLAAWISALIIAAVTYILCIIGVIIGKKCGMKLSNKAQILGGIILIAVGLEIFISAL